MSHQHGANLGPVNPIWAPWWPHELCYQGSMPVTILSYYKLTPVTSKSVCPNTGWFVRHANISVNPGSKLEWWMCDNLSYENTNNYCCVRCYWVDLNNYMIMCVSSKPFLPVIKMVAPLQPDQSYKCAKVNAVSLTNLGKYTVMYLKQNQWTETRFYVFIIQK